MNKELAIILLSGGMDSAVCASWALAEGYELAALHINYGQRTETKELNSFNNLCNYYSIDKKLIVDISYLAAIGGSSLTDMNIEVSKAKLDTDEIPTSYVPFRNANILAIATSWAEVIKANKLIIGAVEEDSSGYPDTRREFFDSFEKVISSGTINTKINILTPLIKLNKKEIVELGTTLNVPFDLTWSCYKSSDIACGECDSCALRLRGFDQAKLVDPIKYKENSVIA